MKAPKVQDHYKSNHADPTDEIRSFVRNQPCRAEEQSGANSEVDGRQQPLLRGARTV